MAYKVPGYSGSNAGTHGSGDSGYWGSGGTAGSGPAADDGTRTSLSKTRVVDGQTQYLYEQGGREVWTNEPYTGHGGQGQGVSRGYSPVVETIKSGRDVIYTGSSPTGVAIYEPDYGYVVADYVGGRVVAKTSKAESGATLYDRITPQASREEAREFISESSVPLGKAMGFKEYKPPGDYSESYVNPNEAAKTGSYYKSLAAEAASRVLTPQEYAELRTGEEKYPTLYGGSINPAGGWVNKLSGLTISGNTNTNNPVSYQVEEFYLSGGYTPINPVSYQIKEFILSDNDGGVLNPPVVSSAKVSNKNVFGLEIPSISEAVIDFRDAAKQVNAMGLKMYGLEEGKSYTLFNIGNTPVMFNPSANFKDEGSGAEYYLAMNKFEQQSLTKKLAEMEQTNADSSSALMMGKEGDYDRYSQEQINLVKGNIKGLSDTSGIEKYNQEYVDRLKYSQGKQLLGEVATAGMIVAPIGIMGQTGKTLTAGLLSMGGAIVTGTGLSLGYTVAEKAVFTIPGASTIIPYPLGPKVVNGVVDQSEPTVLGGLANVGVLAASAYAGGKIYKGVSNWYKSYSGNVPDLNYNLKTRFVNKNGVSTRVGLGTMDYTDVFGTKTNYNKIVLGEDIIPAGKSLSLAESDFMMNEPSLIGTRNIAATTKSIATIQGEPSVVDNTGMYKIAGQHVMAGENIGFKMPNAGVGTSEFYESGLTLPKTVFVEEALPQTTQKMSLASRFFTSGREVIGLGKAYWNRYFGSSGVSDMNVISNYDTLQRPNGNKLITGASQGIGDLWQPPKGMEVGNVFGTGESIGKSTTLKGNDVSVMGFEPPGESLLRQFNKVGTLTKTESFIGLDLSTASGGSAGGGESSGLNWGAGNTAQVLKQVTKASDAAVNQHAGSLIQSGKTEFNTGVNKGFMGGSISASMYASKNINAGASGVQSMMAAGLEQQLKPLSISSTRVNVVPKQNLMIRSDTQIRSDVVSASQLVPSDVVSASQLVPSDVVSASQLVPRIDMITRRDVGGRTDLIPKMETIIRSDILGRIDILLRMDLLARTDLITPTTHIPGGGLFSGIGGPQGGGASGYGRRPRWMRALKRNPLPSASQAFGYVVPKGFINPFASGKSKSKRIKRAKKKKRR